ncbi:hypothetical protein LVW35_23340 [Pseudomonas sp. HN11]|uniref:hypothetical protein n=1 Tax=Pseudomonas sp. HN11 TaxID=1344094 RepID=UPI001F33C12F|nr:hypothetical protein [Pseudomonas sp. HN11]UII70556.1 hypothetical protein LVW35_23340 [Pseudomonas sp. HN11]
MYINDTQLKTGPAPHLSTDNPYTNYSDSALIKHLENNFERFADSRHRNQFVTKHSLTEVAQRDKNSPGYNKQDSDFAKTLLSKEQLLTEITDYKRAARHDDGVFISHSDTAIFNSYNDQMRSQKLSY